MGPTLGLMTGTGSRLGGQLGTKTSGSTGGTNPFGGVLDNYIRGQMERSPLLRLLDPQLAAGGGRPRDLPIMQPQREGPPKAGGSPRADLSDRAAIKSIESQGSGDYKAVGPRHPKLGRALGAYQIMEANIGPWSEETFGKRVSVKEFMDRPDIQDAIFDKKFGDYKRRYGSAEDAASAWFTGEPRSSKSAKARDFFGTSGAGYVERFKSAKYRTSGRGGTIPDTLPADTAPGGVLGPEANTPLAGTVAATPTARDPWEGLRERVKDPWAHMRRLPDPEQLELPEEAPIPQPNPVAERQARIANLEKYAALAASSPALKSLYRPDKMAILRKYATI